VADYTEIKSYCNYNTNYNTNCGVNMVRT